MSCSDGQNGRKINRIAVCVTKIIVTIFSASSLLCIASAGFAQGSPWDYDGPAKKGIDSSSSKGDDHQGEDGEKEGGRDPFATYTLPDKPAEPKKPAANQQAAAKQGGKPGTGGDESQVPTDVMRYQYVERATVGQIKPQVILNPVFDFGRTVVTIKRNDGKVIRKSFKGLRAGGKYSIPLNQPKGVYSYELVLQGQIPNRQLVQRSFKFNVAYGDPIKVKLNTNDLDLGNRKMTIHVNRQMKMIELAFVGDDGEVFYEQSTDVSDQGNKITFTWPEPEKPIHLMRVRVIDKDGFYSAAEINPFWFQVPHQEIEFETGKTSWLDVENHKLENTLKAIQKAIANSGRKKDDFQLYIAGYTDTVGSNEDNLVLSKGRATEIAKWFLDRKLGIPIFVQGFGEEALAMKTGDNVANQLNRRVVYVIGTGKPPKSATFPRADWTEVKK